MTPQDMPGTNEHVLRIQSRTPSPLPVYISSSNLRGIWRNEANESVELHTNSVKTVPQTPLTIGVLSAMPTPTVTPAVFNVRRTRSLTQVGSALNELDTPPRLQTIFHSWNWYGACGILNARFAVEIAIKCQDFAWASMQHRELKTSILSQTPSHIMLLEE
jgi:hypothetical protein